MKTLDQIRLTPSQRQALTELERRISDAFKIRSISLFGSIVRDEADEESDIDLLIITEKPLKRPERHQITDIIFEVNLRFGTNFSSLVVDRSAWERGLFTVLPLKEEILQEGVTL